MRHDNEPAPIVIGAVGGSGTRVLVDILGGAGVFMGSDLNASNDAMQFVDVYDRWIDPIWRGAAFDQAALDADLRGAAGRHRAAITDPGQAWGWKNPRVIYLLAAVDALWPGLRFIHVIRDGRDMAFSANQNQLRLHGEAILGTEHADAHPAVRSAALWSRINGNAAELGRQRLGQRYRCLRFEDLCDDPLSALGGLLDWLQLPAAPVGELAALVKAPDSLGRWQQQDASVIADIEAVAGEGLRAFGYR